MSPELAVIIPKIEALSEQCPHLECDGFTNVVTYLLTEAGIDHTCYKGHVSSGGMPAIPYHLWVEVGGYILDYRCRMWLGERLSVPHGCFLPSEYPDFGYSGVPTILDVPKLIYEFLIESD